MSDLGPLGRVRKKVPKQRSMMTEEEQLANPEGGVEEQGYMETLGDALTQGKENLPGVNTEAVGIGKLETGAESAIGRLAKKVPSKGVYNAAIRDAGKMEEMVKDLPKAEKAYADEQKAIRAGSQRMKDIKEQAIYNPSKASEGPALEYNKMKFPESKKVYGGSGAREYPVEALKAKLPGAEDKLLYTENPKGFVQRLQNEMQELMSAGKYQEAKAKLKEIEAARAGKQINSYPAGT